jgi:hypothetical protein
MTAVRASTTESNLVTGKMLLSEDELRRVSQGEPIGDVWPFRGGEGVEIESFLWQVVEDIARCPTLEVYTAFEDDEGTADWQSFLEVFYMPLKRWEEHPRSSDHDIAYGLRVTFAATRRLLPSVRVT